MFDLSQQEEELVLLFNNFVDSFELNAARGMSTMEKCNASYTLTSSEFIPVLPSVTMASADYITAEWADAMLGVNVPRSTIKVEPSWADELNEDGTTSSLYGYHFFTPIDGVTPLQRAVGILCADEDTRRASVMILQPKHMADLFIPCTYAYNFRIRNGKLDVSVHQRSQDIINGLFHDVAFARLMQKLVLESVKTVCPDGPLTVGTLHFSVDSLHCYEKDMDKLRLLDLSFASVEKCYQKAKELNHSYK